ncbi:tetratricopeptide repeat protein [Streptomyces sp. NPDC051183]|uniref:tetratricopeptide repeat protein n=1 Tax=Streptomyces sp. NPDC051183 TaxID=3155165 RepID=UPI0034234C20
MLFERLGMEWARHLAPRDGAPGRVAEGTIQGALEALAQGELAAFLDNERRAELLQDLPGLIDRGRTDVLSGSRETEHMGRMLIALGAHSAEGLAAGHFLIGYALQFDRKDGRRQFEQARLAYRDLGSRTLEALSALAAEASRAESRAVDLSDGGLPAAFESFDALEAADGDCARRLAPYIARFRTLLRLTRELAEGAAPPAGLPDVTGDELNTLRTAMVSARHTPERIAPIARWIQALRGLPADSTEELDGMAEMLGEFHRWEPRIRLLRDMIAHGDRRPETLTRLALSLLEAGNWSEAKALLTARIGDRPGPQHLELVKFLVMCCVRTSDPDAAAWATTLKVLGGELPASAMPPPSQVRELAARAAGPRLLARYENGSLTIDPSLAGLGPEAMAAHMRAAMIIGLGPVEGARLRDDVAVKEPGLFPKVVELLPPHLRPQSSADRHLAMAEEHFTNSEFRKAVAEYRKAIEADPELEYAHLGLGDAYYMLGDFHLAAAHFTESIAIRPTPQAYRFLGDAVLKGQGDRRRARQCYEQALALDPAYGGAREALALLTGDSRGGPAGGR